MPNYIYLTYTLLIIQIIYINIHELFLNDDKKINKKYVITCKSMYK